MEPDNFDSDSTPPAQPTKHTQFLDLTNGEGGDVSAAMYDGDYGAAGSGNVADGGTTSASSATSGNAGTAVASSTYAGASGMKFNPNTPGRVVETGQEHTGRWTREEHEAFLSALKMYGKEWKKVAAKVKTRTVVQTRTHAQKYFQKLAKSAEGKDDQGEVEMRVVSEAKKPASQKKKPRLSPQPQHLLAPRAETVARTASVASAAQVMTSLHQSQQQSLSSGDSPTSMAHGFQTASTATPNADQSHDQFPSSHGFSNAFAEPKPVYSTPHSASKSSIGTSSFPMKIVAPAHDSAMKRGKFPEPSPAACGKRKLAEIAAARMLAGVAASETLLPPPPSGVKSNSATTTDLSETIEDGTATPPPEELAATTEKLHLPPPSPKSRVAAAPAPPAMAQPKKPLGLSLQIVNPESLSVSHEQIEKRRPGFPSDSMGGPAAGLGQVRIGEPSVFVNSCSFPLTFRFAFSQSNQLIVVVDVQ